MLVARRACAMPSVRRSCAVPCGVCVPCVLWALCAHHTPSKQRRRKKYFEAAHPPSNAIMSAEEIIEQRNLFHAGNYQSSVNAGISLNLSGDSGVLSIFPSLPFPSLPFPSLPFSPFLLLLNIGPFMHSHPLHNLRYLPFSEAFPASSWTRFLHHRAVSTLAPTRLHAFLSPLRTTCSRCGGAQRSTSPVQRPLPSPRFTSTGATCASNSGIWCLRKSRTRTPPRPTSRRCVLCPRHPLFAPCPPFSFGCVGHQYR